MTSLRIRPRFKHHAVASPEEVKAKLQRALDEDGSPLVGRIMNSYIVLRIPMETRHFWSPQLSISVEEHEEGGSIVRGLYGPHPSIWAFFTYGYGAIGIITLFVLVIGGGNLALGKSGLILWALPVLLIMVLLIWFIAQTGQKIGVEETFRLHQFYENTIKDKVQID